MTLLSLIMVSQLLALKDICCCFCSCYFYIYIPTLCFSQQFGGNVLQIGGNVLQIGGNVLQIGGSVLQIDGNVHRALHASNTLYSQQ